MKEIDQELLSRILDEEISEFETQRILKEMQSSPEHQATLQRYNMIGHAMRKDLPSTLNHNFASEVMGKLSGEVILDSGLGQTVSSPNRFKAVVGLAIAASVAVFSFVAFQNFIQPNTDATPIVAERIIEESDIQRVSTEDLQNFIADPIVAAEFNSYIVNHAEYASPRASMPHVRIVGYDQDQYIDNN
ncbi:MAG: sigma-E factor negative regulatory protein [Gammaproteobacteria bacterium]|jgi:hypothetical protein|nr:sigma-E factor negative regulatory protein [Gammaproteobacteria bacterium]